MSVDPNFKRGPLSDLRVIEMGTLLAGPFCGQLLGDMGAEVIKVEPPGQGDPMRNWGRQKAGEPSLWWPVVARNKKAITLDMRQEEGQSILKDLVKNADFLLENFRPGTLEKWNCGYEELAKINPRLIMIRVSGYGQTGPYSHRAGFGAIGEAMGGMRYVVGDPSTPPSRMGISIGDELAATFACLGALSALHYREKTGHGQVVDSALYEAVLAMMESLITEYDKMGYIREQARGTNQKLLDGLVEAWTQTLTTREVLEAMDKHGVPAGLIYRAPDMLEDPHFKARNAIVQTKHPYFGDLKMQNVAPKLSATPGGIHSAAPTDLGQHNDEVYGKLLGFSAERLAALRASKVI